MVHDHQYCHCAGMECDKVSKELRQKIAHCSEEQRELGDLIMELNTEIKELKEQQHHVASLLEAIYSEIKPTLDKLASSPLIRAMTGIKRP